MLSIYIAVSNAEKSKAISPAMVRGWASDTAATPILHLLWKPQKSGIPIRDSEATVKHANDILIFLPIPSSSYMYSFPVCSITMPQQKNEHIFVSECMSICANAAVRPSGVIMVAANRIYERLLMVEYASLLLKCLSFTANDEPNTMVMIASAITRYCAHVP